MNDETGAFGAESPVAEPALSGIVTDGELLDRRLNADDVKSWNRKRRLQFLDDLIRTLDITIYAHIATVYYLDNSFLRFAFRCLVQLIYLMPRTSTMLPEPPTQPNIGGIFGANILCLFSHLYFARPQAGEATREYLHGGLMLDFVGQLGPTSKLRLVALDVAILLMQLVALSAMPKRKELAKSAKASRAAPAGGATALTAAQPSPTAQDLDAEERGVLRRASTSSEAAEDTESQPMLPESSSTSSNRAAHRALRTSDLLWSGQSTIVELYVWDTIKEAPAHSAPISPDLRVLQRGRWQLNLPFRS